MARTEQLLDYARRLRCASVGRDWARLGEADRDLGAGWPRLATGRWTAAELAALRSLRAAHGEALQHCNMAAAALRERLQALADQRDGWFAYADADDAGTTPHARENPR